MMSVLAFGRAICGDLAQSLQREWLITNGLGGFGSGTIGGCQTRRYHGLLIAAERPPVGRTMLLVDLDIIARVDGRQYELACHEYEGGFINPHGYRLIESFRLEGSVPTWIYALGSARLVKRVFMAPAKNTTYICYSLKRASAPISLSLHPLCTGRDYHWQRRGREGFQTQPIVGGCRVSASGVNAALALTADLGAFTLAPDMHWNLHHRAEAARGLDSTEDLYTPGFFNVDLNPGETLTLTASAEAEAAAAAAAQTGAAVLEYLKYRDAQLMNAVGAGEPAWIRQLALAADQYIVTRMGTASGKTVIAGYPWFADWGRDTMIALPGLTLATKRTDVAVDILRTFADHIHQGLLPNRFPDSGDPPEYNTADATLWYFVAIFEYLRMTADLAFAREICPVLLNVIDWHRRGTCNAIAVDPTDGLLRSGTAGLQLTWMDAKVADWVVTPRTGKAVEINALWCNALWIMGQILGQVGESREAQRFDAQARLACDAFAKRFWYEHGQYLYDVIDTPEGAAPDASLRPNQLIALSLPRAVIDDERARLALGACERELVTTYGVRTLDCDNPHYVAHYGGDQRQRDGAYHQGTVWPWLLGAFARAHLRLYGDVARAASYLAPLEQHLADACIGQISEIFDADAPHAPQGCGAQAWSVAEILRSWLEIHSAARTGHG